MYTFDGIDELRDTKQELAEIERHDIYAHNADHDEWADLPYRDSLWTADSTPVGDVSANTDHYHVFQPADIIDYEAQALEQYTDTVRPKGHIRESGDGRKLTVYTDLDGLEVEPFDGDVYELGKRTTHAHTGMHGLHHDIGAVRMVCTNGMVAFDSEKQFSQTHSKPLDYALFEHAYDSIVSGVDEVEDRIQAAADQEFVNRDEALLVLTDLGIDTYLPDDPLDTLRDALEEELDTYQEQPSLYDTYNAATRALTHADRMDADTRDRGLERAARLLDHDGDVPDAATVGQQAVEQRVDQYTTDNEIEPYWDNEEETLHDLIAAHNG
ncbi:DUF932 domain-containing protein [Natrinema sp. 1APR25-10V2]|uniref:DUF932 domain-containing protein n=1 Tax=Natrinema sp. 1APR25-10V2 TaxID=2951081 RepID=UPI002876459A|nr:DUF932 domain-containing protein [Natrinema sp. 1APR25-10V2]MDS0476820.1 DUF945 domain-containing protein [Natrinema sp. 1APR25-10V2]